MSELIRNLQAKLKEGDLSFNQYRTKLISSTINNSSNSEKLKKLQWRIDQIIKRRTTLGATIEIYSMMMTSAINMSEYVLGSEVEKTSKK